MSAEAHDVIEHALAQRIDERGLWGMKVEDVDGCTDADEVLHALNEAGFFVFGVADDERWMLMNALEDYAEWAADAANDKRNEAQHADPPDEGLDAEADHYENDRACALAVLDRLRAVPLPEPLAQPTSGAA